MAQLLELRPMKLRAGTHCKPTDRASSESRMHPSFNQWFHNMNGKVIRERDPVRQLKNNRLTRFPSPLAGSQSKKRADSRNEVHIEENACQA